MIDHKDSKADKAARCSTTTCCCNLPEGAACRCRWVLIALMCLVLAFGAYYLAAPETMAVKTVTLVRQDGTAFPIEAEVTATPEQMERGLMERTELPEGKGMLFPFDPPREVTFWMKDTPLPLDILFIERGGRIIRITEAKPNDETPLPSGGIVTAVLEIKGGEAKRLRLSVGDVVR